MSCSVCYGHPGCPCCSTEPRYITCPTCNGTGEIYYNEAGDRIIEEEYGRLPAEQRECERCAKCNGTGGIEDYYGPDYDE